ncbi:glycoside hydrolase family 35 protein [Desarmillaria tabescens]|uniref:beta-galactosidase n=1 Tax=Armillaria tabescens TaxID=1929756 RepID=A0AA39U453_ARMTA|nr:glycoside hydrolase family 35 protein [Desarmillaria tabescens]KAK0470339.1 glycoside hydrolase family 35 protein [Desarmillaria tabescens]
MKTIFVSILFSVIAAGLSTHLSGRQSTEDESSKYVLPVGSPDFYNGRSSAAVTFDQRSVLLDGKRAMIFSGEFHPFRLPAPELWYDVLEKFKASGFNGVSVYWHWGLSAPNAKEIRFTDHNNLTAFYEVAKQVGILVIVRPGPYVNAETAGGGIPAWVSNLPGLARTNATDYKEAWLPYIEQFSRETAPYQYPDGPVIGTGPLENAGVALMYLLQAVQSENEYFTSQSLGIPGLSEHMQDIEDTYRANGLTKIPTIHNDKNAGAQYSEPGLGKVDLYGWDGYPLGFDCDKPEVWTELSTRGAFNYWSGPNYDNCYKLINEQFANVYYKNNYAAGTAIQNLYMTYGGTNWGNMHTHTIYSSYDYGAAIREDRTLTPKIDELKLQSYFLHASPDYLLAGRIGNGTVGSGTAYSDSADIYTTHLHSPASGANFYFVRQLTNTKTTDTDFSLRVNTTIGNELSIPRANSLTLAGRESKIIVTNYPFGSSTLIYSTAEVMTWATFDGVDTIIVYVLEGQYVEIALRASFARPKVTPKGSSSVSTKTSGNIVTVSGSASGISVLTIDNIRLIIADKKTAGGFWVTHFSLGYGHDHYDVSPDVPSVFVRGPYLVRSVSHHGSTLNLIGDLNGTTTIDVFGPSVYTSLTWNGQPIAVKQSDIGSLRGVISFPDYLNDVDIPRMEVVDWRCADSLPELALDFDDTAWIVANKTSTRRPQQPTAGKYVLYSSEYGYHAGQWVWRGHFSGNATGVSLDIQGGFSFGYSAFLNGRFLGSGQGSSHSQDGVDILSPTYNFTVNQLVDGDNVLTIIHDSTGMNQDYNIDDEFKTPRGIRGYTLHSNDGSDFTEWRIAGNVGGEFAPDYVRGPYNEGGWWFERVGAHLPGYEASSWNKSCTPYDGISKAGVAVYRTTFDLDIPRLSDVPLAFDFELDYVNPYRLLIYVNGWQFGRLVHKSRRPSPLLKSLHRFLSSLGPQVSYPIPEGILNHHGTNEVLISLWALNSTGAKLSKLELNKRATLSSSKAATVNTVNAPGWDELRGGQSTTVLRRKKVKPESRCNPMPRHVP